MDTKDILIVGALGIVGFVVYEKMKTPAVDPNALLESTFHKAQTTTVDDTSPALKAGASLFKVLFVKA